MTFLHIPANVSVLLDANIFIYYFTPDPVFGPQCQILMERITSNRPNLNQAGELASLRA